MKKLQAFRIDENLLKRLEEEARARGLNKTEELERVLMRYYNSRVCW